MSVYAPSFKKKSAGNCRPFWKNSIEERRQIKAAIAWLKSRRKFFDAKTGRYLGPDYKPLPTRPTTAPTLLNIGSIPADLPRKQGNLPGLFGPEKTNEKGEQNQ
jgi:hypothetical protein